jgi:ribosomal protein L7/L12
MPGLRPDQVQDIHDLLHEHRKIDAIKLYREATGTSLADAKKAIDEMALNESIKPPDDERDYDNPILISRVKSLLSRNRKIDAIKIYREEYGVGLKEARIAVDKIQATMEKSGTSSSAYEPAISADPFASNGQNIRMIIVLAVVVGIAVCGAGVFFLLLAV